MYVIDKESKTPLHIQLFEAIKQEIQSSLNVGDKLASIREVSATYKLSKTTVENAYRQLYAEGFVESKHKSGYFVSDMNYEAFSTPKTSTTELQRVEKRYKYDFYPARLSEDVFPLKIYKRLANKALDSSLRFGSYGDGAGEIGLREEISRYIGESRGVVCEAEEIIICAGFSDAMALLARLVKKEYKEFAMESPGYHVARRVFKEYSYDVKDVEVGDMGLSLSSLQASGAKMLYITPSHHYPTGVSMPISQRLKLLEYVQKMQGLIIEDDYDSELVYNNRPIPSLQGLSNGESVVYMGTFAKSLSPMLRVSFMVLPKRLLPLFRESYDAHFPRVSLVVQKSLELFMREGHWRRHLRRVRLLNKKKHNIMLEVFKNELKKSVEVVAQGAGLAILINPKVAFNMQNFRELCEGKGIKLYFAKERSGGEFEALRMGFGGFSEEELVEALRVFVEVWRESEQKNSHSLSLN